MPIAYKTNEPLQVADVIAVYDSSGLNRPTNDPARIQQMLDHSNLTISAWDGEQLVGVARSFSDFCYATYLSDLAIRKEYQHQSIGKQLIALTRQAVGDGSMLLLLSAPDAMEYYPKVGFEKVENGFIIQRTLKW
jgi:predicted N-acetyltransferase YhbS